MISNMVNLIASKDLVRELTLAELRSQTADRKLGWFWWLLDPLIMMLIYWAIVAGIFNRGERYAPYAVFILCALLPFKHFSDCVAKGCSVLRTRDALIKSVPFPTMVLPISLILSGFASFLFGLVILFGAAVAFGRPVNGSLVQLPALMLCQLAVVTGACLLVSCLGALFYDLVSISGHLTRILFYLSPTLYGIDMVYERAAKAEEAGVPMAEWISPLYLLNPFASLITGYREALFYGRFLDAHYWPILIVQSLVVLWVGYRVYQYFERRVIKFL